MTIHVLLVDDQSVVHKGLRTFLAYDPDLDVVGERRTGLRRCRSQQAQDKPEPVSVVTRSPEARLT
jgi:DNA-binding NarL/FixJ family response regulator